MQVVVYTGGVASVPKTGSTSNAGAATDDGRSALNATQDKMISTPSAAGAVTDLNLGFVTAVAVGRCYRDTAVLGPL
jgi:hypothetical protein